MSEQRVPDAIREFVDASAGSEPGAWTVTVTVTGNGFNGTSPLAFVVRDGRIASLRIS